jgi:hypothetical protein
MHEYPLVSPAPETGNIKPISPLCSRRTELSIARYRSVPPVGPLILGSIDALRCGLELCSRAVCRNPDSCAAVHSSFADSRRASAETPDPISHSFHTTPMLFVALFEMNRLIRRINLPSASK